EAAEAPAFRGCLEGNLRAVAGERAAGIDRGEAGLIAGGAEGEGHGTRSELRAGDHEVTASGDDGAGGKLEFPRHAEVIAEPPAAEISRHRGGIVELDEVLAAGRGAGQDFMNDDRRR